MSLSESAFGRRVSAAFSNGGFFENKFPLSPPQNDIPTYLRMLVCPALTNSPEKVSASNWRMTQGLVLSAYF